LKFLPSTTIELEVSSKLTARMRREHNKIIRDLGINEMKIHLRDNIPGHFRQDARRKHKHAKRNGGYKAIKKARFGSILDLVKTKRTKLNMRIGRIQAGGSFFRSSESKLSPGRVFRLFLRFPFPTSFSSAKPGAVTVKQMAKEIAHVTDEEAREKGERLKRLYVRRVNALPKTTVRRKKVKIS